MNKDRVKEILSKYKSKESIFKNILFAFFGGGFISLIAEGLIYVYSYYFSNDESIVLMSITLVVITSLLTRLGLYKHIGRCIGAGSFLPVTGFANSVTSGAIEGASEGSIIGVGSKIFSLAGSVILSGVVASFILVCIKFLVSFWW